MSKATATTPAPSALEQLKSEQRIDEQQRASVLAQIERDHMALNAVDVPRHERLAARARQGDQQREVWRLDGRIEERAGRIAALAMTEREQRRAGFLNEKRTLVAALDRALTAAALANSVLAEAEAREALACGDSVVLSWHELKPETALTGSRLASWRRFCGTEGLL